MKASDTEAASAELAKLEELVSALERMERSISFVLYVDLPDMDRLVEVLRTQQLSVLGQAAHETVLKKISESLKRLEALGLEPDTVDLSSVPMKYGGKLKHDR